MKLIINPLPGNKLFTEDQQIIMSMEHDGKLEVFYKEGMSYPDRHFLLSLAQMAMFAIEEDDHQYLDHLEEAEIEVHKAEKITKLKSNLLIARSDDGKFAALIIGDSNKAKKMAGQSVRNLTGRIRLDVP
ncbi:MAG: hypothetical protein ACP5VS_13135 [Desulfomonilaceae bacterium]